MQIVRPCALDVFAVPFPQGDRSARKVQRVIRPAGAKANNDRKQSRRVMNRSLIGTIVLMLLLPATQLAGQADAGPSAQARIEAARQRIIASGVPVGLIDQRIAEGRAKGATSERIAEVVERRVEALLSAGAALRPTVARPSAAELGAGADALEAGIPADALRRAVADARVDDRAIALAVLTYLYRERGLPVETALQNVREAAAQGPAALRDLPARAADRARGAGAGASGPPAGRGRVPGERNAGARGNPGNRGNPDPRPNEPGGPRNP